MNFTELVILFEELQSIELFVYSNCCLNYRGDTCAGRCELEYEVSEKCASIDSSRFIGCEKVYSIYKSDFVHVYSGVHSNAPIRYHNYKVQKIVTSPEDQRRIRVYLRKE